MSSETNRRSRRGGARLFSEPSRRAMEEQLPLVPSYVGERRLGAARRRAAAGERGQPLGVVDQDVPDAVPVQDLGRLCRAGKSSRVCPVGTRSECSGTAIGSPPHWARTSAARARGSKERKLPRRPVPA